MGERVKKLSWEVTMGEKVEKLIKEVDELIERRSRFEGGLVLDDVYNPEELLAPELVGEQFEENKSKFLECIMQENVNIIGVWGMGGSGKTTLVTHIHNVLLQMVNDFQSVYWITVSQDFSVFRLQNLLAKAIGLKDFKEEDEIKRAAILSRVLKQKQNWVLILDDLWDDFYLEKVGIPVQAGGCKCKLILTCRSSIICQKMGCNEMVRVNILCEEDAWKLFRKTLGEPLPSNITVIAKSITRECDGLPLGIKIIAGCMRGVDDVYEWRNAFTKLQDSKADEVDGNDEVFKVLNFSYDRLSNLKLKNCFLCCALFPEDHMIARMELIEHLIDEELINGESREVKFNEGHSILNKLERVCLLEGYDDKYIGRCVKMHDLIRDMAIKIMQRDQNALVEAGKRLIKMPEKEKWTKNTLRCSLMYNNIREIPPGYSPKCPNLSTLLLSNNVQLKSISASFFEQLDGLKVLDLSYTTIDELPSSLSCLVNLSALLLQRCDILSHFPSLENLKALKKLDLRYSGIREVPEGIQFLSELRYLDFVGTQIKQLPSGILSELSNLQFLSLGFITISAEDLAKLVKLETLVCGICDVSEFNAYTSISPANLRHFFIFVGKVDKEFFEEMYDDVGKENKKVVIVKGCKINSVAILLPKKVEELTIMLCISETNELRLQNVTKLEKFTIQHCNGIASLSSTDIFQSLEEMYIKDLDDLEFMFSREATIPESPPLSTFPLLKEFSFSFCPKIKQLFPLASLSNLQSLEMIEVYCCQSMEELIAMEEEGEGSQHSIEFTLPKLKYLKLVGLPELKSICSRRLICNSLEKIDVQNCLKLKQIPYPLPSLQRIRVLPRESWDSFEFEDPDAKDLLFPFCKFSEYD